MNEQEINKRLSALIVQMSVKGLTTPSAQVWINSDSDPVVYMNWKNPAAGEWDSYSARNPSASARAVNVTQALSKAEDIIRAMPDREQRQFDEFMKVVAQAVDLGRKNGIDVDFVNPLEKLMKDLSENAITDQRK